MKRFTVLLFVFISVLLPLYCDELPATLILIRPQEKQIENLVVLKKEQLLPQNIQILAVYHEDERTDYAPSRLYVEENRLNWVHFRAIKGGIPLDSVRPARGPNPWTEQFSMLFRDSDGIIFTGGMDLPPWLYGEETRLTTETTTPLRSVYELSFLHHLVGDAEKSITPLLDKRPDYAVLCICLGCQTLNVAAGGTLIQNIPSQVYGLSTFEQVLRQNPDQIHSGRYLIGLNQHIAEFLPPAMHPIRPNGQGQITPKLSKIGSSTPMILSSHHQALGTLGHSLLVTATSTDGRITEMIEHTQFPAVLGVQFHPEAAALYRDDIRYRTPGVFNGRHETKPETDKRREWLNHGSISPDLTRKLRQELEKSESMPFHRAIWTWFSTALQISRANR